jgi:FMN phosphatase YigB (HAD superfamily)
MPSRGVIRAVCFDWGNTLVAWELDAELFIEGHVRGLDRLREDVGGAQALGMAAIQALWFERDDSGAAVPDATASTPADVLRWITT